MMKKHSAFSLIELSVIIIICGLLIAGVMKGSSLLKSAKLTAARALTDKSPVIDMRGLLFWYETSLLTSFDDGISVDNSQIATWHNNISKLSDNQNDDATQSISSSQPLFIENAFNGAIPAVRFDGVNDYLLFNGNALINTDYTLIAVEQRRAQPGYRFIGGTYPGSQSAILFGYWSHSAVFNGHYGGQVVSYAIDNYTHPIPRIHTYQTSSSSGKKYWLNSGNNPDASNSSYTDNLTRFDGAAIGRSFSNFFNGDLAEIIMFNRALNDNERKSIERYLSKKYNIDLD